MMDLEICPKVRRFSQSMKNILKKPSIYRNGFINIREGSFLLAVDFDENDNPVFKAVFPPEIIEGMKNGTINFDNNEISAICIEAERKAREQIKLKLNPTRVCHN